MQTVSVETAKRLVAAGWAHELQIGDWVAIHPSALWPSPEPGIVWTVGHGRGTPPFCRVAWSDGTAQLYDAAECLHLPTAEQILEQLAVEGYQVEVTIQQLSPTGHDCWVQIVWPVEIEPKRSAELVEAVAMVYLAVHEKGGDV